MDRSTTQRYRTCDFSSVLVLLPGSAARLQGMESGLVSVCMPVFNRQSMVAAAMRSVLDQSYEQLELIVVDDGSTDETVDVVRATADGRVRLIETERRGVVHARWTALEHARGQFSATMDSDDLCVPDRLVRQVEVLRSGVHVCAGQIELFWNEPGDHQGRQQVRPETKEDCVAELLRSNPVANNAVMFHTRTFRDMNDFYRQDEVPSADYALWARLLPREDLLFVNLGKTLVHYRGHSGQMTQPGLHKNQLASRNVRVRMFTLLGFDGWDPRVKVHCDVFGSRRRGIRPEEYAILEAFYPEVVERSRYVSGFSAMALKKRVRLFLDEAASRLKSDGR